MWYTRIRTFTGMKDGHSYIPDNTNRNFGLAVINDRLTSVGGFNNGSYTNTLLSLTVKGERQQWSEVLPPMPIPRQNATCVTTEQAVVVAGGDAGDPVDTVEMMNINNKQWTVASSLPQNFSLLSAAVSGDKLFLAGGIIKGYKPSKSVPFQSSCHLVHVGPDYDEKSVENAIYGRRSAVYQ